MIIQKEIRFEYNKNQLNALARKLKEHNPGVYGEHDIPEIEAELVREAQRVVHCIANQNKDFTTCATAGWLILVHRWESNRPFHIQFLIDPNILFLEENAPYQV